MLPAAMVLVVGLSTPAFADTIGWRTDGDGRYLDATPPTEWSSSKNVVWKTAMPEWSNAMPVMLTDQSKMFVCSEPDEIMAVDPSNGKILWKRVDSRCQPGQCQSA